jgi:hypothetical protein
MNAMVIVEPRKHPYLKQVCENFDKNMPPDWDLYVVHGNSNATFAKDAVKDIQRHKVFIPLPVNNLSANTYNKLFKQLSFWNKIKAENILVFQTDASLCANSSFNIKDFMKYDYIGCSRNYAFKDKPDWGGKHADSYFYGIGGLSFRKNSFQKKCIRDHPNIPPYYSEDVFYSNCVANSPNRPKSIRALQNFCSQSHGFKSFGAHKTKKINKSFYGFCPEAKFHSKLI